MKEITIVFNKSLSESLIEKFNITLNRIGERYLFITDVKTHSIDLIDASEKCTFLKTQESGETFLKMLDARLIRLDYGSDNFKSKMAVILDISDTDSTESRIRGLF